MNADKVRKSNLSKSPFKKDKVSNRGRPRNSLFKLEKNATAIFDNNMTTFTATDPNSRNVTFKINRTSISLRPAINNASNNNQSRNSFSEFEGRKSNQSSFIERLRTNPLLNKNKTNSNNDILKEDEIQWTQRENTIKTESNLNSNNKIKQHTKIKNVSVDIAQKNDVNKDLSPDISATTIPPSQDIMPSPFVLVMPDRGDNDGEQKQKSETKPLKNVSKLISQQKPNHQIQIKQEETLLSPREVIRDEKCDLNLLPPAAKRRKLENNNTLGSNNINHKSVHDFRTPNFASKNLNVCNSSSNVAKNQNAKKCIYTQSQEQLINDLLEIKENYF